MVYQMGRKPQAVYEMGLLNSAELRIIELHSLLKEGIKPWEWDYENYSDHDMDGKFYQEDWHNLRAIDSMINDKENASIRAQATREAASK